VTFFILDIGIEHHDKITFLFFMTMTILTQIAFAHPYINDTSINDVADTISGITILGGENESYPKDLKMKFLSNRWKVKNFLWIMLAPLLFLYVFLE